MCPENDIHAHENATDEMAILGKIKIQHMPMTIMWPNRNKDMQNLIYILLNIFYIYINHGFLEYPTISVFQ